MTTRVAGSRAMVLRLLFSALCTACSPPTPEPAAQTSDCGQRFTAIANVQGNGARSELEGQRVTVKGVVTLTLPGTAFFLESVDPDNSPLTSEALFIADGSAPEAPSVGTALVLTGTVTELGGGHDTQTALTNVAISTRCRSVSSMPLTELQFPITQQQRESLENMRLSLTRPMTATDIFAASRGNLGLSADGMLRVPTEVHRPGPDVAAMERKNASQVIPIRWSSLPVPVRAGTQIERITGVLGHDNRGKRLIVTQAQTVAAPSTPLPAPMGRDVLRIAVLNLHNFFNGNGKGGGFLTRRGARNDEEFTRQRKRIAAAVNALGAHLLAVQELENDGFGADSAAQSLLDTIAIDAAPWQIIHSASGRIGQDEITVGLLYRPDRLEPIEHPEMLSVAPFYESRRQPLAQQFRDKHSSRTFLVIVVHLKSKGSCPDSGPNANQGDGQSCWNTARKQMAEGIAAWARKQGDRQANILILGDFNAYRMEDPIEVMRNADFVDLVATHTPLPTYTYAYFGRHGSLDHAFASPSLAKYVRDGWIWHVNAAWPAGVDLPQPWLRFSDHDPVVVDLLFNQSATSD